VNGNSCAAPNELAWPDNVGAAFDKAGFCEQFHATVQAVWNHFLTDETDGFEHHQADFYKDCGLPPAPTPDANVTNACIIQHIVGYNSKVLGGQLPGQVQAILRGVAYDAQDGSPQYQFDPFLTFGVPFTSQFSLDPYTRLIHSTQDGVSAVAYSFSIDSFGGSLALRITPVEQRSVDAYTGSAVSVWSLPIGSTFSGQPPITSNLGDADLQACRGESSLADLCVNVTMSATWADDPLARDVVYMGLHPEAMPRVNINLPAAPLMPPDPRQVTWPPDAGIKSQPQSDDTSVSPRTQTPQLFGCYPSTSQCGDAAFETHFMRH
jgi:hypothetical protein